MLAAAVRGGPDAEVALATLCEAYWYPVYAFVRRRGYSVSDAQDSTQEFFSQLLEKDYVRSADREKGRFRTFLLTAVSRFLSRQREHDAAQKRGGTQRIVSINFAEGESRYLLEPTDDWTPERLYERRWALELLDRVLARLELQYDQQGKSELFERLKGHLTGTSNDVSLAEVADELRLTEGALKVVVHRLRRRYRDMLKEEIAGTVSSADEVSDELEILLAALRGQNS